MSKYLGKLSPIFSRASEWSKTTRKVKFDSFKDIDWKKKIADTASEGALLATEIMVIVGAFQIVTHYFVNFTFCVGPSMLPTINQSGDVVLIDLISYKIMNEEYKTGDVVISLNPYDSKKTVCKRIAATAGEVIFISKDNAPGSSSVGVAITKQELSSSSSTSNSSTEVSIRSLELDNKCNSSFRESGNLKSDCSAKEQAGDPAHNTGSPAVESSGGGDKGTDTYTGALKIENTNPIVETVTNIRILEENAGGLSAADSPVSSIEDSQIAVTPRVRKLKKKPRKPVQVYSEPYIIPPGHVWLAGDNTANSTDSRFYGPVPVALLRGRVFLKFVLKYPPFEAVISSPEILYQKGPQPKDIVADYVELNLKAVEGILQNNEDKGQLLITSDHEGEKKI